MAEGLWNGLQALTQGPEPGFQPTVPTGNPRMERVRNKHSNTGRFWGRGSLISQLYHGNRGLILSLALTLYEEQLGKPRLCLACSGAAGQRSPPPGCLPGYTGSFPLRPTSECSSFLRCDLHALFLEFLSYIFWWFGTSDVPSSFKHT